LTQGPIFAEPKFLCHIMIVGIREVQQMPQSHFEADPPPKPELQPPCPTCGNPMWLIRLSKFDKDKDLRTFRCIVCDCIESSVVEFKAPSSTNS
jgi:hypothetical protein